METEPFLRAIKEYYLTKKKIKLKLEKVIKAGAAITDTESQENKLLAKAVKEISSRHGVSEKSLIARINGFRKNGGSVASLEGHEHRMKVLAVKYVSVICKKCHKRFNGLPGTLTCSRYCGSKLIRAMAVCSNCNQDYPGTKRTMRNAKLGKNVYCSHRCKGVGGAAARLAADMRSTTK